MRKSHLAILTATMMCFGSASLFAATPTKTLWHQQTATSAPSDYVKKHVTVGNQLSTDLAGLQSLLNKNHGQIEIAIPMPDGTTRLFSLSQTQTMSPKLAAKFPDIKSFAGVDISQPDNTGRFDLSPEGFSGMFKYQEQWVFLTFDKDATENRYVSYFAKDERRQTRQHPVQPDYLLMPTLARKYALQETSAKLSARPNGDSLTTYRLAVSASGEYTRENGGEAGALAEIVRMVNRMNQVFLADLSIQFELVDNNDRLIFTDAETDPFSNDANEDLEANQTTIDNLIGSANYDMGHIVNTDGGGLATLRSICVPGFKARGQSGSSRPFGESFYIQLVIHEFGHQLGADHTFNATDTSACNDDQRSRFAAVEPGSGTTIMSYAGLCGAQDVENDADAYFHSFSIEQIQENLANESCGVTVNNGNAIPTISTSAINHTIPANTPFMLTADVTDTDNDPLTFIWDQVDPGNFDGATSSSVELSTDNGENPLFRSFPPTDSPTRFFPQIQDVLNDIVSFGEVYPTTQRQLNFELLVRDGEGGVNTLDASLSVEPTGESFSVSAPITTSRWVGGMAQDVSWNVAGTTSAPISCSNVDILLDANGDSTFESTLLTSTPNDGQQDVIAPSTSSTVARLMVKCSENVFYAVNPGQFELLAGDTPIAPLIQDQITKSVSEDTTFTIGFDELVVDDPDSDYPSNFTLSVAAGNNYSVSGTDITPDNDFFGTLSVNVSVNDGVNDSNEFAFTVQVSAVNDTPIANDDSATVEEDSGTTLFNVLSNDSDADQDTLSVVEVTYVGSATVSIQNGQISYTPANGFFGTDNILYRVEDPSLATDTATLTIEVTQTPVTPVPQPDPPATSSGGGGALGSLMILLAILRLSVFVNSYRGAKSC